ncbi:MAG TPA: hypothetical protein VFJ16_11970 [Longimicrobium sp.]|nr:hypothetical protein [Longimicrobium sp.]
MGRCCRGFIRPIDIGQSLARRASQACHGLLIARPPALLTGQRTTRYFVFRGPAQEPADASAEYTVDLHEDMGVQ